MSDFETAINFVLKNEDGLNVDKRDRGGITNFGISLRFLCGVCAEHLHECNIFEQPNEETIKNLTIDQARKLYKLEFWDNAPFDQILNQEFCNYIFDMAVNMGIHPAIKLVQRACWAVMRKWELLQDDGIMGEKTLIAIDKCGFMIMPALRAERANFYRNLAKIEPDEKEYLNGWFNRTYNC